MALAIMLHIGIKDSVFDSMPFIKSCKSYNCLHLCTLELLVSKLGLLGPVITALVGVIFMNAIILP